MSNPWMKFYPSDWRSDPRLRMCSLAARGLWLEMIAVMHEAEPYGHLVVNGHGLSHKQIGALAGCTAEEATTLLIELEQAGVYSTTIDGIMFSRRMVRDKQKADRNRENGSHGGNPELKSDKPPVNPEVKAEDKAQKPEARSQKPEKNPGENFFEEFWAAFPKRKGDNPKAPARKSYLSALKSGADPPILLQAAKKYAQSDLGDPKFIPMVVTWLNQRRWEQWLPDPAEEQRIAEKAEYMRSKGYVWNGEKWEKAA